MNRNNLQLYLTYNILILSKDRISREYTLGYHGLYSCRGGMDVIINEFDRSPKHVPLNSTN